MDRFLDCIWLNGIALQITLGSCRPQEATALFFVTALEEDVTSFRWIQGLTLWQTVWLESSSFGSSQKENCGHQSCYVGRNYTIHWEMPIIFSNDPKRRWSESFRFLKDYMQLLHAEAKCMEPWPTSGDFLPICTFCRTLKSIPSRSRPLSLFSRFSIVILSSICSVVSQVIRLASCLRLNLTTFYCFGDISNPLTNPKTDVEMAMLPF